MTNINADKYDEEEFEKLWGSAKADGEISIGTLFHHAKQNNPVSINNQQTKGAPDLRDIRNGRLYAEENRERLLFIQETKTALFFGKFGWELAPPGTEVRAAKEIVEKMMLEALQLFKNDPDDQHAKRLYKHVSQSSSLQRIQAMIEIARSEEGMTARLSQFDSDPNLLGVKNGILDLKARELIDIKPKILVSMRCNVIYDPLTRCSLFMQFLTDIQPDPEIRRLLQQLSGLFLSGDSNLQMLIFLYGHGANGKTTFIELLAWLLCEYTKRIPTEMLMMQQRNTQGPSPDIVALKGRRMVYCNEVEEGRHLAEGRVKELTGGDTLSGRVPYAKEDITFRPSHKLVMIGNHQPEIHDMSHGMWRRMLLIPFEQTIAPDKRDDNLLEKLKAEGPGILNWMLSGYHDYLTYGLVIPKSIKSATNAYKSEQDVIGEWVGEHCMVDAVQSTDKHELYKAYRNWSKSRGQFPLAQSRFTRKLADRGYRLDPGRRKVTCLVLNSEGVKALRGFAD